MNENIVDLYNHPSKMYVSTDCIVFGFDKGELKLLVFRRLIGPKKDEWSLVGSFVEFVEDVDAAAKRVLKKITGLDNVFFEQSKTYGMADRDPGYRCVSIAQYALIRIDEHDKALVREHGAYWFKLEDLPKLVLDHDKMVADALEKVRRKARYQPIGFELLPEKFTIPQLQSLYEAIFQKKFDSGNFRKKVLATNVLNKLTEKDKSTSKKGSFLYTFNRENYERLVHSGFNFEI